MGRLNLVPCRLIGRTLALTVEKSRSESWRGNQFLAGSGGCANSPRDPYINIGGLAPMQIGKWNIPRLINFFHWHFLLPADRETSNERPFI